MTQQYSTPGRQGATRAAPSISSPDRAEDSEDNVRGTPVSGSWRSVVVLRDTAGQQDAGGSNFRAHTRKSTTCSQRLAPAPQPSATAWVSTSSSDREGGGSGDGTADSMDSPAAGGDALKRAMPRGCGCPTHRYTRSGGLGRSMSNDSLGVPLHPARTGSRSYSALDVAATGNGASPRGARYLATGPSAPTLEPQSPPRPGVIHTGAYP